MFANHLVMTMALVLAPKSAPPTEPSPRDAASAEGAPDMCWMFFAQRFGHARNIGFVDLLRVWSTATGRVDHV